jgi:chromosome segregation ATPase
MMKQVVIAAIVFTTAGLVHGQAPAPSTRQASMDDLLAELRALRADMQQRTETSIRAQLLVARLQVQEQRVAAVAKDVAQVEEQMRALEGARNPALTQMIKNMEEPSGDADAASLFAGVKAQLEKIENGDPVLKERHAGLTRQLSEEQARWAAFNAQLEALENQLATRGGR